MIKFFRKIRQKLVAENISHGMTGRISKYLVYAIGEIALVMIGILLALQVNNWNLDRQEDQKIKVYLASLRLDLLDDIDAMVKMERYNSFRYYSMQYLLRTAGIPEYDIIGDKSSIVDWSSENTIWNDEIPTEYDTNFIKLAFLWTHRVTPNQIERSTINEMKNIGLYAQWSNAELKSTIDEYYNLVNFRIGPYDFDSPDIENWLNALYKLGISNSNPYIYGDPLILLKENRELSGYLRSLIREAGWAVNGGPIVSNKAKELIKAIDLYLSNSKVEKAVN